MMTVVNVIDKYYGDVTALSVKVVYFYFPYLYLSKNNCKKR